MGFYLGVSHPLRYTDEGDVAREDEGRLARRLALMRACGVGWILCDMPFPFEGGSGGARFKTTTEAFRHFVELVSRWTDAGFKVLGVSPYPAGFEGGWKVDLGKPGSSRFLRTYGEACRFLAQEFGGAVSAWLVANQLNLERFRRPLTEKQALAFLKRGGAGLKRGNPSALVGVNMFGFGESALRMYSALYPNDEVDFDYVGTNGFFGTFDPGGPTEWHGKLALLGETTGKPVIVLEFGYASAGDVMVPAERASGRTHHEFKKLPHVWRLGHTPENQAAYLEEAFWIFTNTPSVLGAFWFSWSDREKCWNCGQADCPAGTANGLVDVNEEPKPAYLAFARVARGEFDPRSLYPDEPALREAGPEELRLEIARRIVRNEALRAEAEYLRGVLRLPPKLYSKSGSKRRKGLASRLGSWLGARRTGRP